MLFSHFLPSVRWNAVIRTLDFKPFENSISVSSTPRAAFGSGSLNIYSQGSNPTGLEEENP